ncbi:hypothetical protein N7507_002297 [Penicillium longicatenatum]|nr:hypothetical protein N7507_002297 [Penicillium longicatenatum]
MSLPRQTRLDAGPVMIIASSNAAEAIGVTAADLDVTTIGAVSEHKHPQFSTNCEFAMERSGLDVRETSA